MAEQHIFICDGCGTQYPATDLQSFGEIFKYYFAGLELDQKCVDKVTAFVATLKPPAA